MIIDIFIVLLVITIAFIMAGYYFEISPMVVVGLAFLFMLGVVIMSTGVEYKTGEMMNESSMTTEITYQYTTYTSTTFGIFICVIAVLWFVITMVNLRRGL
jgi:hypothetical protein